MKTLQMPLKYVQDENLLKNLIKLTNFYGKNYIFISDSNVINIIQEKIMDIFKDEKNSSYKILNYKDNCTQKEIDRLTSIIKDMKCDIIVGIGGGKSLDIAKIIASNLDKNLVIIPTTASTDSATSALSAVYKENGSFDKYIYHNKNPHLILVDTSILVKAPIRYLVAGMGESLSTYYEAKACYDSKSLNILGGTPSLSSISISKLALDIILEKGFLAKLSAEKGIINEAFDQVIEANIFMSGFGFENSGLAAAHAIHNGIMEIESSKNYLHGEIIAFSTIVQLVIENQAIDEILKIIDFCQKIKLPYRLSDLGIIDNIDEKVKIIAEKACSQKDTMKHMPFNISKTMVYDAIIVADKLGSYE